MGFDKSFGIAIMVGKDVLDLIENVLHESQAFVEFSACPHFH